MSKIQKKKVGILVDVFNHVRVPLSSNQRKELAKIYPYYGAQNIVDYVDNYLFDGEYILVAEDGENLRSNNQNICNLVRGKFWVNNHAHILKGNLSNDTLYLYYNFNRINFEPYVTGSAQPKLNKENLLNIEAFVHIDKNDQQKIASVLFTLDTKIELNNKINTELEDMAKTLYDYWFVQFDFPNENGKPYKSSGGEMVWSEELKREIPKGWEVKKLKEIESNIITGKTPSTEISEYFNGDVQFICIGDVRGNMHIVRTELTLSRKGADSQKNKYIPKGTICVTCIASPGLVGFATEEAQTNQQLNSVVCENIENRYYLYFYLTDYFKYAKAKTGNTFANMNKEDFSSILVLKPNHDLLKIFAERVNPLIEKILVNSKENQELAELRDWLLPMLMNGQVVVE